MTDTAATPAPSSPAPARRKRSIIGILLKLFVALVVLIIVGLVVLYFLRNALVRMGVERGGHYATQQETSLGLADLALFNGKLDLSKLDIANIKKNASDNTYQQPNILTMNSCNVVVQPKSLFTDTVVVDSIKIDGLELTLEQNGSRNNLNDLMDILKQQTPASGANTNTSPGKQLKINALDLTGIKVHIRAKPLPDMDLDLGDIHMEDPTNPDGRPMKIADLIGKILIHLSQQIVNNPALPGELKANMKNVTALVNNLQKDLNKDLKGVGQQLQDLSKNPQQAIQNLTTNKSVQDATKGLQNLLNQNKNNSK